jgi:MoaA/NifB/PqqE/SkfB family radical SAM enzyme
MLEAKTVTKAARIARRNPHFINLLARIAWRNTSNLIDYNLSDGKSFAPKAVTFRISGVCNLFCQMCNFRQGGILDSKDVLPLDIFYKVIDDVYQKKLWISFTGGEPLMHPHIIDCIRYVREKGLHCSLVTNGWFLAKYAQDIVDAGVDILTVSIDGPQEIHDKIRGRKGLYQRVLQGIQEVKSYSNRPPLFFSTTIQADNYTRLAEVVDCAVKAGMDGVSIQHLQSRTPDRTSLHNQLHPDYQVSDGWINESLFSVDPAVLQHELRRAKQKGLLVSVFPTLSPEDMSTWYSDPMQLLSERTIKCPWFMANVFHDGTMRACDEFIVGDLREEGFWDIWNGPKMVAFRRKAKASKTFPICATCCSLYRTHAI